MHGSVTCQPKTKNAFNVLFQTQVMYSFVLFRQIGNPWSHTVCIVTVTRNSNMEARAVQCTLKRKRMVRVDIYFSQRASLCSTSQPEQRSVSSPGSDLSSKWGFRVQRLAPTRQPGGTTDKITPVLQTDKIIPMIKTDKTTPVF